MQFWGSDTIRQEIHSGCVAIFFLYWKNGTLAVEIAKNGSKLMEQRIIGTVRKSSAPRMLKVPFFRNHILAFRRGVSYTSITFKWGEMAVICKVQAPRCSSTYQHCPCCYTHIADCCESKKHIHLPISLMFSGFLIPPMDHF